MVDTLECIKFFVRIASMKKKISFIVFVLFVCGALGFYFYQKLVSKNKNTGGSDQLVGNDNTVNVGGVTAQGEGGANGIKIEKIDIANDKPSVKIPVPDLDREIKIIDNMSEDAVKIVTDKIKSISDQLKKDSDSLENWLILGIYRKMINDFEGAKLAWEYAGAIRPQSSTPFNNLGELYAYQLKDNAKAEENYLKAVKNEPSAIYIYRNSFDFYRYFTKNMIKARAILEQGIANNPNTSSDLKKLLESI